MPIVASCLCVTDTGIILRENIQVNERKIPSYQNESALRYLEVSSSSQHRLDSPHPIVVVMLWGQLLRTESISGHNFHRQGPCSHKAARVEHNFCDHCIVRHHHSHSPEQSLVWRDTFAEWKQVFNFKTFWTEVILKLCSFPISFYISNVWRQAYTRLIFWITFSIKTEVYTADFPTVIQMPQLCVWICLKCCVPEITIWTRKIERMAERVLELILYLEVVW